MKVTLVKFDNLLEKEKDEHIGVLMDESKLLCLCCFGMFLEEDYTILERKEVEFETVNELLTYIMEVRNDEKLI